VGRRWEEPLTSALGNCWKSEVLTKGWFAKAGEFVQKTYKDMHLKSPEDRYGRPILRTQEEPTAKRRSGLGAQANMGTFSTW